MTIGQKLRELRGKKSQEEVSREIGITKSAIAMYERDERVPRDEIKIKIAKYYGISVQELFFGTDEHK